VRSVGERVRVAEIVGVLSMAAEAGTSGAVSADQGPRAAILAVRIARDLRLDESIAADAYYVALLKYIGCVGDSDIAAEVLGDEVEFGRLLDGVDFGDPSVLLPAVLKLRWRGLGEGSGLFAVAKTLVNLPKMASAGKTHCELAQMLARELSMPESVERAVTQGFERWNGKGHPKMLKGEAIDLAVRIAHVAEDASIAARLGGTETVVTVMRERAGKGLDPKLAKHVHDNAAKYSAALQVPSLWSAMLDAEPKPAFLDDEQLDRALNALAAFGDLKSMYTRTHSAGVSTLAASAGERLGMLPADVTALRRAALIHDLGRPGVSAGVWDKPGPLSDAEWERVRMHTYLGERILSRAKGLEREAAIASLAHERVDASGYHRRLPNAALSVAARVLAAADCYHAMTEARAHRPAKTPEEAATELRKEARAGHLDGEAVEAVLACAGHRARSRKERPAGISDRELEVLRLVARGLTNKEIGSALGISAKTAGHHLQHLYTKIGVTTRAAAALFAMQHDLLEIPGQQT
jgi:HD-GYP domain-containing protein (c-di-GMP phosphodiesterase class II)